jgi:chromosome segregation ATPase
MVDSHEMGEHPLSGPQRELEEAHKEIRTLLRQLGKEQSRQDEISRAYNLTVHNLMEMTRENVALERECQEWRSRAEQQPAFAFDPRSPFPKLSQAEIGAIRKAITRLHNSGAGADGHRLQAWYAFLDALEP